MKNDDQKFSDCCRPFDMDAGREDDLAGLLDRCGRYFAHRIGGSRRGQSNVMAFLADHPNATQKELSEGLDITPASLSEVLMKLERKGLVDRVKDESDRRFVRVCLTAEGEKRLKEPADGSADPFVSLSDEERETMKTLLGKLLADWENREEYNRHPERPHHRNEERRGHGGHGEGHHGHGGGLHHEGGRHDR